MRGARSAPSACTSNDEQQANGVQAGIDHLFDGLRAYKIGIVTPGRKFVGDIFEPLDSVPLPIPLVRMRTLLALLTLVLFTACTKEQPDPIPTPAPQDGPRLIMKFKLDSTQERLGNLGQPVSVPPGHAAQSPRFNGISAHYVEFAPTGLTALGTGAVVYHAPETTAGGDNAIDFAQEVIVPHGGTFLSIPLTDLVPGNYSWLRVSLAYQNYDVDFRYTDPVWGV